MLVIIVTITFISSNLRNEQTYTHSFTKAICTENNYCADYEIFCKGNNILRMTPTGAAIQFSGDWEDPRDEESRNKFC